MKRKAFHLTVPSDASPDLYPQNTPDQFQVKLTPKITLDPRGQWEIGLTQFIMPSKFKTVTRNYYFYLVNGQGKKGSVTYVDTDQSAQTFLAGLNKAFQTAKTEMVTKKYWHANDTLTLKTDGAAIKNPVCFLFGVNDVKTLKDQTVMNGIYLNPALAHLFGFDEAVLLQTVNFYHYWRQSVPDLDYGDVNPKQHKLSLTVSDLYQTAVNPKSKEFDIELEQDPGTPILITAVNKHLKQTLVASGGAKREMWPSFL